tara:strand:- start:114 stop:323 length:210 start_codon:yes stop_codon:yes gene_type:complete
MTAQEMIQAKYSGELSSMMDYINIMAQVFGILIVGIIIWRAFARHQNKKQNERFKSDYFESSYSKHWRK